ncbi:MAG TPA: 1-acyl-sn-glycerol-3-phosphate acyltransferase [Rariglobus sp.]|jgi:1-acyl-sn-glycerol-3-phosphate acyltransferase|nr:1-acyl-sn-glycerol-3-phosphate acyltransferase [Rariglobus sp.]
MALFELSGSLARRLVRSLVKFYYPRIEVTGADKIPQSGPVLLAANHPNSLIDPVLISIAARRPVRLMAKAPLFDIPFFGKVLRALGMVPAYRGSDDKAQVKKNLESLAAAAAQLAAGHAMGIFPEGKSHDENRLALVRSGAARLALQALAAGAQGLKVVPVGLHYEQKERFRSAVWIKVGEPVDVAEWLEKNQGDEHLAMRTLTTELDARLKSVVLHLDEAGWQPLLEELEALLPAAGFRRRDALNGLRRQQAAVDAINYFYRTDRPRAEAAAARVRAHGEALRAAGVPRDEAELSLRSMRLVGSFFLTIINLIAGACFGIFGAIAHLLPYGLVRILSKLLPSPGKMTLALNRLLIGVPVYAVWYAITAWWLNDYFLRWVVITWLVLMPVSGLVALDNARRWKKLFPRLRAEARLLVRPKLRASLLASQADVVRELGELAAEFNTVMPSADTTVTATRRYRPPIWVNVTAGAAVLAVLIGFGAWLLRDRPTEFLRNDAPELADMSPARLAEQMAGDERSLVAVISGLAELEKTSRAFEADMNAGRRSYYKQADDEEIRRMLVTFLSYRAVLLRTVWKYQNNEDIAEGPARLRARLLEYTAAAVAYDYSMRFVREFDGQELAMRKLNEAEPRWDLPAGTYNLIRANLANLAQRRWMENGWKNYETTLPRWQTAGLAAGEPHVTFHASIRMAEKNAMERPTELVAYKVDTALADVKGAAKGSYYRASSAVSTLIGDTKIREPRHGKPLITPELLERLRPLLQPGDVLVERRNWFLSNAFLPGYWPHSALYVGTPEQLKALGLDSDPRIRKHFEEFSGTDASGHQHAIIEAVSEGVVFSTVEHSIGEADSLAVLRPKLTPEQKHEVIARAFSHSGKPYDFDFDFFSADKLVCTELVYRSLNGMVDFPLVSILGTKTLPAVEIVRYWRSPAGASLMEFVGYLDGDERTGKCNWADADDLAASVDRPALTWLQ